MKIQTSIECLNCGDGVKITDTESGEVICSNCGFVISDKAEESSRELHAFAIDGSEASSTTSSTSLARPGMGLSTVIGMPGKNTSQGSMSSGMASISRSTIERLKIWDLRLQRLTDRNLRQALRELGRLKDKLNMPDAVVEKTAYIYRKAQEIGLVRGRTVSSVLAAALYIACREMDLPRNLEEIASISNVKPKTLAKTYRMIVLELNLKIPMIDLKKCITKIGNRLDLGERQKRYAMDLLEEFIRQGYSAGKDPMGLAASAIYISCIRFGERKTQSEIAKSANISEVTLRNIRKQIEQVNKNNIKSNSIKKQRKILETAGL